MLPILINIILYVIVKESLSVGRGVKRACVVCSKVYPRASCADLLNQNGKIANHFQKTVHISNSIGEPSAHRKGTFHFPPLLIFVFADPRINTENSVGIKTNKLRISFINKHFQLSSSCSLQYLCLPSDSCTKVLKRDRVI